MSIILLLIPLSIALAAVFLGAFIWAVRSGQYEDTDTPAQRLLLEEKHPTQSAIARHSAKNDERPKND